MSNGIQWQFDEATLYSYERADELQKAIEEAGVVKDTEKGTVASFCILLMHTRQVSFDRARVKSESLKKLPDFLATWENLTPAQLWDYRRKHISHNLWGQWGKDLASEGNQLMADPSELPDDMLTEAQKADSFLA